nr:MAG TPA: hypothetical protein [Bacteriophage sp.]
MPIVFNLSILFIEGLPDLLNRLIVFTKVSLKEGLFSPKLSNLSKRVFIVL